jgi:hypothetical protein
MGKWTSFSYRYRWSCAAERQDAVIHAEGRQRHQRASCAEDSCEQDAWPKTDPPEKRMSFHDCRHPQVIRRPARVSSLIFRRNRALTRPSVSSAKIRSVVRRSIDRTRRGSTDLGHRCYWRNPTLLYLTSPTSDGRHRPTRRGSTDLVHPRYSGNPNYPSSTIAHRTILRL